MSPYQQPEAQARAHINVIPEMEGHLREELEDELITFLKFATSMGFRE